MQISYLWPSKWSSKVPRRVSLQGIGDLTVEFEDNQPPRTGDREEQREN